ncbi:hypothetical protein ACJU26_11295 [Acidithiobacillus sp. M4-SHS-6]
MNPRVIAHPANLQGRDFNGDFKEEYAHLFYQRQPFRARQYHPAL